VPKGQLVKMILAREHGKKCEYGCCGNLPGQSFAGTHKSQTKTDIKRALKKRDRQEWKKEL